MSHSPSQHHIETESLSPADTATKRREKRDEADYRDACEASYGMITLGAEILHPADILDKCATDAARRARAETKQQVRDDVEQLVCEQFPATIAVPFHRFLEGPTAPLTRLHHLRDSWEALVRLLAALAVAEAATFGTRMSPLELRESESQQFRKCTRRDLRSGKLSVRIGLIEAVLRQAGSDRVDLEIAKLLPTDAPAEIRRLNVIRNGFSHEAAKSEKQAQELIADAYPSVVELLVDLREFQQVDLFRVSKLIPGSDCGNIEVERLEGHAQSQRFRSVAMGSAELAVAMSAANVDGLHRVLARVGSRVLDLSPYLYTTEDETGHRTRILEFKQRKNSLWHMECVAESTTESFACGPHDTLLQRYSNLLGSAES